MEKDENCDARRIARRISPVRISAPNFLYGVLATKWRSKSSFREFSSGSANNKARTYLRSAFYRRRRVRMYFEKLLTRLAVLREFARATPPFRADDVDVATQKIIFQHGSKSEIITHLPSRYRCTKIIIKSLRNSQFFSALNFCARKMHWMNVVFNIYKHV